MGVRLHPCPGFPSCSPCLKAWCPALRKVQRGSARLAKMECRAWCGLEPQARTSFQTPLLGLPAGVPPLERGSVLSSLPPHALQPWGLRPGLPGSSGKAGGVGGSERRALSPSRQLPRTAVGGTGARPPLRLRPGVCGLFAPGVEPKEGLSCVSEGPRGRTTPGLAAETQARPAAQLCRVRDAAVGSAPGSHFPSPPPPACAPVSSYCRAQQPERACWLSGATGRRGS